MDAMITEHIPFTDKERAERYEWAKRVVFVSGYDMRPDYQEAVVSMRYERTLRLIEIAYRVLGKELDVLKSELEEVSADRDSWRYCTQIS